METPQRAGTVPVPASAGARRPGPVTGDDNVERGERRAVERALDVALIVMRNGGPTSMADRTFQNVLCGLGETGITAAWRSDLVAAGRAGGGPGPVVMRPVGNLAVRLGRASEAVALGERAAAGELDGEDVDAEIERINALDPHYSALVLVSTAMVSAVCFARLNGADWGAVGAAATASGVGQLLRGRFNAKGLQPTLVTLFCGIVSAGLGALAVRLGLTASIPAALIGSVIYLVPGLALINGFLDTVSQGHLVVGLERIANAAFLFAVIAIATGLAFAVFL